MEILRVPPYSTEVTIDVSLPNMEYEYTVEDMVDHSIVTDTVTSSDTDTVTIPLSSTYDNQYKVTIDAEEHIIDVVRPYVNPNTKGDNATEINEYSKNEQFARAIIDSIIPEGFYYKKVILQTSGLGTDFIPLWVDAKKVLQVYENNVLVYDASDPDSYERSYSISKDNTAVVEDYAGVINRAEGAPLVIPAAESDLLDLRFSYRGFVKGFDYTLVLTAGYQKVPADIVRAAELLIDDLECGRLDYFRRGVTNYSNEQFRISFDKYIFDGTGNILVDKILSKYAKSIRTVGVI
jgi:hypothetical protein